MDILDAKYNINSIFSSHLPRNQKKPVYIRKMSAGFYEEVLGVALIAMHRRIEFVRRLA